MSSLRENKMINNRPRSFAFSKKTYGMPGIRTGIHVLRKLPGLEYCRPSWKNTETILRIFPGLNPDNPKEFDSFRVSEELGRYGIFQCCLEAVRKFGENGVTFLLHDGSDPHYNAYQSNPCWILYRAIKNACEQGNGKPEFFPLLQRGGNRGAPLCAPTEICLVQGMLFRYDSKDLYGEGKPPYGISSNDPTIIFELSKSAADSMFALFDERNENYEGDPDDDAAFKYGNPVSIDDGVFVHFYEHGTDLSARSSTKPLSPSSIYTQKAGSTQKKTREIGYACHLTKTLDGNPGDIPATLTGNEDMVRRKWKPWNEILEFMTDQEQAHLINPLFPPSAIMYAFRDRKDWILEETKRAAVGTKTFDMGNTEPQSTLAAQADWRNTLPAAQTKMPVNFEVIQKAMQGDPTAVAFCRANGLMPPVSVATPPNAGGLVDFPPVDVAVPVGSIADGMTENMDNLPSNKQDIKKELDEAKKRAGMFTRK